MAKFFNKFPKVLYSLGENKSLDYTTNITVRYALEDKFKENSAAYNNHFISDGETPEILAHQFYGSSEAHWIILLLNDIIDPQYDWPMNYDTLNRFISSKYSVPEYADTANTDISGLTWSNSNFKEYYKVQKTTNPTGQPQEVFITIDKDTYDTFQLISPYEITLADNTVITREFYRFAKTYYEYEIEENEKRREILILRPELVADLESQLEEFLNV